MLAKKNRLPLREIPKFFPESKKFFTNDVTFFYQKKTDTEAISEWQAAIIIPKKAVKKAVDRHRYKRLIANFLQQEIERWLKDLRVAMVATARISEETLANSLEKFKNFLML